MWQMMEEFIWNYHKRMVRYYESGDRIPSKSVQKLYDTLHSMDKARDR